MTIHPEASLDECMEEISALEAEVERLTTAIQRIDGINDNPANYNPAINAVCDAILRLHLEPKPNLQDVAPDVAPTPDAKSET